MALPRLPCIVFSVGRDLRSSASRLSTARPEATPAGDELTPGEVLAALERVRRSQTISGSEKLVQFLSFVVQTTLNGNAGYLKETVVGVFVFGRAPDYDPKADTVVRSQAWRLRSKLSEYYQAEGADDPLIIDIPRGSYVPVFVRRSHVTASRSRGLHDALAPTDGESKPEMRRRRPESLSPAQSGRIDKNGPR
jgi:hypothetical protein